jgi:surface antigen
VIDGVHYDGPGCDPQARSDLIFYWGGCTYWAYEERPDVLNTDPWLNWSSLANWQPNAIKEGYSVNQTPEPGDIALIYPVGSYGGHVAYVESVNNTAGTVTVTEMNTNGDPNVQTETSSQGAFNAYIHQK